MLLAVARLLVAACVVLLLPALVRAEDVTLAWDPPRGAAPDGYRVRYGKLPGPVTHDRDAGRQTTFKVTGLQPGTRYEFHVVAYDQRGLVSAPSNRVEVAIPGTPAPPPDPPKPPNPPKPPADTPVTTPFFPDPAVRVDRHAPEPHRQYLAEGAQSGTYATSFSLANPTTRAATATIYLRREGDAVSHVGTVSVPPLGHRDVSASSILRQRTGTFGVGVTSSEELGVARSVSINGSAGVHSEVAVASPSRAWYFAEGATHGRYELFYVLFNPGQTPATVSVTYLLPSGALAPRTYEVAPHSRTTIWVDQEGPELAATDVGAVIESTNGEPIVAERAVYLRSGTSYGGGHVSLGARTLRTRWLMADGATGPYFTTLVLLANPHARTAVVTVNFRRTDGVLVQRSVRLPGGGRVTLNPGALDTRLKDTAFWTEVVAPADLPIVAERVTWWPGQQWLDGHTALAADTPGARWLAVGGHQGGSSRQATYLVVANTSSSTQKVRVTLLGASGPLGTTVVDVPGSRRHSVDVGAVFPQVRGAFSALVEAVGGKGQLVVEQTLYRDAGNKQWGAGSAIPARPVND